MRARVLWMALPLFLGCCLAGSHAQDRPDIRPRSDLRGHRQAVTHVAFHPGGKLLASAGAEGKIRLWDVETGRVVRELFPRGRVVTGPSDLTPQPRRIEWLAFSPDGRMLAEVAANGPLRSTVRLWSPEDGSEIRELGSGGEGVRCLAFTPDGKLVATNVREGRAWRYKITLREVDTGRVAAELDEKGFAPVLVAISPDGKRLASAGGRSIHIWDLPQRKLMHEISSHKEAVRALCFSPDGKLLASASADDMIRVWNPETGKQVREIEAKQDGVLALAYSPSGKTLASGGTDKTIKLWKADSGMLRARLSGHLDKVLSVAYSPDGQTLASGSADTTIALWNVGKLEEEEPEEEEEDQWEDDFWKAED